jgi:hypothetical protein
VNQLVVGALAVSYVIDLLAEQVQHGRHIAMVFPQISQKVRKQDRHSRLPLFVFHLILRAEKLP